MNISSSVRKSLIKQQTTLAGQGTKTSQTTSKIPVDTVDLNSSSAGKSALAGVGYLALGAGLLAACTLPPTHAVSAMVTQGAKIATVTGSLGLLGSVGEGEVALITGGLGFMAGASYAAINSIAATGVTGGAALAGGLLGGVLLTSFGGFGVAATLAGGNNLVEAGQRAFA